MRHSTIRDAEAPPIEQIIRRIKQNGEDIKKYYVLNNQGYPVVKADLIYPNKQYEVTYFIEDAELLTSDNYIIRFTVNEKGTENIITDTLNWKPVKGRAGILLSMDDAFLANWEKYLDLYDKYEARLTFFIEGRYAHFFDKAVERGHDVGYHSLNHRDLRGMSHQGLYAEVITPAETLRRQGVPLLSFAFPYGYSDARVRNILFEHFRLLRGYSIRLRIYNEEEIKSGYIISTAIDNIVIPNEARFKRLITIWFRTVKFMGDGWILPLTSHDISSYIYGITPARLEFLFQTAVDLNLQFYRYSDLVRGF